MAIEQTAEELAAALSPLQLAQLCIDLQAALDRLLDARARLILPTSTPERAQ